MNIKLKILSAVKIYAHLLKLPSNDLIISIIILILYLYLSIQEQFMGKLEKFKKLKHEIPEKSIAWRIYGKGMENFGDNKMMSEIPIPEPKADEILVRSDAVGLCFSDTKIIKFGSGHPRLKGRDLKKDPVIPGHEAALTIIKTGKNRMKDYKPGERYIIQADVYYRGKSTAYGYVLPGSLSQYGIIGKEVLDGDNGSYLIQVHKKDISYSETALVEPWACVVASYRIQHRDGIKKHGNLLMIGTGKDEKDWQFKNLFQGKAPKLIILAGVGDAVQEKISTRLSGSGCKTVSITKTTTPSAIKNLMEKYTGSTGFDDIIILGNIGTEVIASAGDSLGAYGILNYMASTDTPQITRIDAGKIHYDRISFIGSTSADVNAPYTVNLDYRLKGDSVILFGAGGPMGQMHVQLVLENKNPPKTVIATDIADNRIKTLKEKFSPLAKRKGIQYHVINPNNYKGQEEVRKEILSLNNNKTFDYIVCLAAIPAVIEDAASYLGDKSILNIFAGVSKETIINLNIKDIGSKSVRFIGSSGSKLDDMEFTLRKVENLELDTNSAVAGIAGINDVWNGIEAVRTGSFPGKIIVYPHIKHLNLISLKELKEKYPKIGALLSENGSWTKEAEEELLNDML